MSQWQLVVDANRVVHAIEHEFDQAVVDTRVTWLMESWLRAGVRS